MPNSGKFTGSTNLPIEGTEYESPQEGFISSDRMYKEPKLENLSDVNWITGSPVLPDNGLYDRLTGNKQTKVSIVSRSHNGTYTAIKPIPHEEPDPGPGPGPEPIIWGPMGQFLIDGLYSAGDIDDIHYAGGSSWLAVVRLQYSGTTNLHIVRSANDGVTWSTVLTIPDYGDRRNKLVTDWTGDWFLGRHAYSSALYETFTYVSSTNGVTWEKVNMPNAGEVGGRFSFAATNGGGIWLNVAENSRNPPLVKRSTDGGRTWATLSPSPGPGGADTIQFLEASRTGVFILAKPGDSGAPSVYKTVDGGNSWQFLTNYSMRVAATNHTGMWVAASGPNGVFISYDDGDSWASVPTPDIVAAGEATSIATDEDRIWIIGYEDGSAAVSYDNAETWEMFVQGLNSGSGSSNRVSTITTSGAQKWMAGFYGGFAAISPPLEPDLETWGPMERFLVAEIQEGSEWNYWSWAVKSIRYVSASTWLAVVINDSDGNNARVVRTVNDGVTWSSVSPTFAYTETVSLVSAGGGNWVLSKSGSELLLSSDNGATWGYFSQPGSTGFQRIATDGSGILVNIHSQAYSTLMRRISTDAGQTWTESVDAGAGASDVIDLFRASKTGTYLLMLGGQTGYGVQRLRSTDNGVTWVSNSNEALQRWDFLETDNKGMWLGGRLSLNISEDDGQTWVSSPSPLPGRITAAATDEAGTWIIGDITGNAAISTDNCVTWTEFVQDLNSGGSGNRINSLVTNKNGRWMAGFDLGYAAISPPHPDPDLLSNIIITIEAKTVDSSYNESWVNVYDINGIKINSRLLDDFGPGEVYVPCFAPYGNNTVGITTNKDFFEIDADLNIVRSYNIPSLPSNQLIMVGKNNGMMICPSDNYYEEPFLLYDITGSPSLVATVGEGDAHAKATMGHNFFAVSCPIPPSNPPTVKIAEIYDLTGTKVSDIIVPYTDFDGFHFDFSPEDDLWVLALSTSEGRRLIQFGSDGNIKADYNADSVFAQPLGMVVSNNGEMVFSRGVGSRSLSVIGPPYETATPIGSNIGYIRGLLLSTDGKSVAASISPGGSTSEVYTFEGNKYTGGFNTRVEATSFVKFPMP